MELEQQKERKSLSLTHYSPCQILICEANLLLCFFPQSLCNGPVDACRLTNMNVVKALQ